MSSPAASSVTGDAASGQLTGQVHLVANQNPKDLVPSMEMWIPGTQGASVAVLGTLSGVTFPMTVTFGEPALVLGTAHTWSWAPPTPTFRCHGRA
jgi:hypothetical protein